MNRGETIAQAKANWQRKPADFYPTPSRATIALLEWLQPRKGLRVREPCCGEGHISRVLENYGLEVTSSDLLYTGYGEGGVDYLTLPEQDKERYDFEAVITNPPFSLAEDFIRRALRDAPLVAMFLPNDYWHAKTRLRLFTSRPPRAVLALTWRPAFLLEERGRSPLANFSWTVWDDSYNGPTQYVPMAKPSRGIPMPPTEGVELGRTGLLGDLLQALERRCST